jgi:protease-4
MFAPTHPFTEDEWERINAWLDAIYRDFTEKAAAGRRMPVERMHELARGRVWTGADAAANGLVDEIGGLQAAAEIARRRAGLPADAPVRVFPRPSPLDQLRPPESSEARPTAADALGFGFGDGYSGYWGYWGWGPAWRLAARAGLPPYGPLMLPGSWIIS